MADPAPYDFVRYLASKKSVDDRALNPRVWSAVAQSIHPVLADRPLAVLELGGGIGAMIERMLDWRLFEPPGNASPVTIEVASIDSSTEAIGEARRRLPRWASEHDFDVEVLESGFVMRRAHLRFAVRFECIDMFAFLEHERGHLTWDLVVGHALLDLLDIRATLLQLLPAVRPHGILYFPITFDGATIFVPEIDRSFDDQVQNLYHASMDQRVIAGKPSGDSRAGRRLFHLLRSTGIDVLSMGSSDWVVFPSDGTYPGDEAYFLHSILHFVHGALQDRAGLGAEQIADWIARRHDQIERGELVYIAHQLDVVGRTLSPTGEPHTPPVDPSDRAEAESSR